MFLIAIPIRQLPTDPHNEGHIKSQEILLDQVLFGYFVDQQLTFIELGFQSAVDFTQFLKNLGKKGKLGLL